MKFVGAHMSISDGIENAPRRAREINARAFALFTKNQRRWNSIPLSPTSITEFNKNLEMAGIEPSHVLPHDSYLINLGNALEEKRKKSLDSFIDEIERVYSLGLSLLNFHPGSHLNEISEEQSLNLIAESLNSAIRQTEKVVLVMENTAGQGTNLGYKFEHLAYIIDRVENFDRIGVCLDTCHLFTAGYDISTDDGFMETMSLFDRLVGFDYLRGMHLNDSKSDCNSHVDRHESIGLGKIGQRAFELIMNDDRFDNIPLILETPNHDLWEEEISELYRMGN